MVTAEQLIAAINPDLYLDAKKEEIKKFKALVKEKGVNGAIKQWKDDGRDFKPQPIMYLPDKQTDNPKFFKKSGVPASHTLTYDSSSETLEPVYFFILDLMNDFGFSTEKLIDTFSSSVGSGYFSEMGQRKSIMQQQGSKILGDINTVLRSVLSLVYDLKEFRIRLQSYDDLKSRDKDRSESARLSLKQIWMDKVDIQKGNSSIKAMALGQAGFVTLIDAFLASDNEKAVKNLDLNERVKRILLPRVQEFNSWIIHSEQELRKRYEIEKTYLKSQVNSLKLYARWAKPYLKAAEELNQAEMGREPALVKSFSTAIFELTLLGKRKLNVKDAAVEGRLPKEFTKDSFLKTLKREYFVCVLVNFRFRGIPQKMQQGFVYGGKVDVSFKAYALNSDEIKKLLEELDKSDINDALALVQGATDESLSKIQEEIDFFMEEDKKEEKSSSSDQSNPFLALIGAYDREPSSGKKDKKKNDQKKEIPKDSWTEAELIRPILAAEAVDNIFSLFDIYKKAHGMPSFA
jgi:hypothetical protein